jgi:hypothetical protein
MLSAFLTRQPCGSLRTLGAGRVLGKATLRIEETVT